MTKKLIPLTSWNKHHEWPPIGGLRHLVFHAKTNGFSQVIRRAGRRILLDEEAYFEWVSSKNPHLKEEDEYGLSSKD